MRNATRRLEAQESVDENLAKLTREAARAGQFPQGLIGRRVLLQEWDTLNREIEGIVLNIGFTALAGVRGPFTAAAPHGVWSILILLDDGAIRPFGLDQYKVHLIG